jgi:hypothetical protein
MQALFREASILVRHVPRANENTARHQYDSHMTSVCFSRNQVLKIEVCSVYTCSATSLISTRHSVREVNRLLISKTWQHKLRIVLLPAVNNAIGNLFPSWRYAWCIYDWYQRVTDCHGARRGVVAVAISYKSEGIGFEDRWGNEMLLMYLIFSALLGHGVYSASNRNKYQWHI